LFEAKRMKKLFIRKQFLRTMTRSINILLILTFFLASCKKDATEQATYEKYLIKPEDVGEFHTLENDNMKIFLPEGFEAVSDEEIKNFHKQIENEKERYYYEKTFELRKAMEGNFYNFYGNNYATEVSVQTLPYMPFSKQNAKHLLFYLRKGNERFQEVTGIYHTKITSTYSGETSLQIFKAKYRLSYFEEEEKEKEDYEMFRTVYLITSNKKTFSVTILTPFEDDFDPYIRKIKL